MDVKKFLKALKNYKKTDFKIKDGKLGSDILLSKGISLSIKKEDDSTFCLSKVSGTIKKDVLSIHGKSSPEFDKMYVSDEVICFFSKSYGVKVYNMNLDEEPMEIEVKKVTYKKGRFTFDVRNYTTENGKLIEA